MPGVPTWQIEPVPCQDCSTPKQDARRLAYADLPPGVKSFEDYKPELVQGGAKALATCRAFVNQEIGQYFLTLQGNNGTGKSHLLQATAKALLNQGLMVKYVHASMFLDELRKTFNRHAGDEATFDEIFDQYLSPDFLVVDDLGIGAYTPWGVDQLWKLIYHRYHKQLRTGFATRLDIDEMAEKLGYDITDRVFDLGSQAAVVLVIGGNSYRTQKDWRSRV